MLLLVDEDADDADDEKESSHTLGRPPRSPSPADAKESRKEQSRVIQMNKIKEIEETFRQRSESKISSRSRTPSPYRSPTPTSDRSSQMDSSRASTPDELRGGFMQSFKFSRKETPPPPDKEEDGDVHSRHVGVSFVEQEDQDGMLAGVKVVRAVRVAEEVVAPQEDSYYSEDDATEAPAEEVVTEPEGEAVQESEVEEVEEEEEEEAWDYATALENAERTKFLRVICMPENLTRSLVRSFIFLVQV